MHKQNKCLYTVLFNNKLSLLTFIIITLKQLFDWVKKHYTNNVSKLQSALLLSKKIH